MFEDFVRDILFAMRVLRKAPLFTVAIVATLAVAISVNGVAFGAMNAVLLKPLPFADVNRLAFICQVIAVRPDRPGCNNSTYETSSVKAFLNMHDPVEKTAMFQILPATLTGFGIPQSKVVAWSSK